MKKRTYITTAACALLTAAALLTACKNEERESLLIVTPAQQTMPAAGGTVEFNIESEGEWWVSGGNEWCSLDPIEGPPGAANTIYITADPNDTGAERSLLFGVRTGTSYVTIRSFGITQPAL